MRKKGSSKLLVFFFQAEDGIRILIVTGVQTCALPISFAHAAEVPENETSVVPPLKIKDVAEGFAQIAEASGKGSREQKYTRLRELVEMASTHERPILFRLLHNELRIGLHDGLIQEAIARASASELKAVRRAALFLSDLAEVAT